jgi:uncharacterized membrane protein (UPF0127 family)
MKRLISAFALLCAVLLGASCKSSRLPVKMLTIETASGKAVQIETELAVSDEEKMHGFMERKTIPDGTGMIFVYNYDHVMHFWMKNTPHPLSIAYIDHSGVIRDIFDMTPYSLATVSSTVSVRYALEVSQGYFDRAGIARGDRLLLDFLAVQ